MWSRVPTRSKGAGNHARMAMKNYRPGPINPSIQEGLTVPPKKYLLTGRRFQAGEGCLGFTNRTINSRLFRGRKRIEIERRGRKTRGIVRERKKPLPSSGKEEIGCEE